MVRKQYKYQCCGYIVSERFEDTHCRQCGRLSPILEEVDKEDMVYMLPVQGHSGDAAEETREWGNFKVLLDEPNVKIKKITVNPNSRLSLQLHRHRSEWWKVIKGEGLATQVKQRFQRYLLIRIQMILKVKKMVG